MKCNRKSIVYGKERIFFDIIHLKRKTMEIAVHPNKSVVVKAPLTSNVEEIVNRVAKRAGWIKRKMLYFEQFNPRTPPRRYVGGESHLYLGRKYRLKIKESELSQVFLKNGYFYIYTRQVSSDSVQKLLEGWYFQKALICFPAIFHLCWEKFKKPHFAKPELKIKKMRIRWGSLSKNACLTLNLDLIKVPQECIEYVVIHELCHLVHYHHGNEFYKLLDSILPDWRQRKHRLEMVLA